MATVRRSLFNVDNLADNLADAPARARGGVRLVASLAGARSLLTRPPRLTRRLVVKSGRTAAWRIKQSERASTYNKLNHCMM
jgi:hypothetical protein